MFQEKDKDNDEYAEEGNGTHDMYMDFSKEDMILDDDEDKHDYVVNED